MIKEFKKIIIELEKWNKKYNKCKDGYLSIGCVNGNWMANNSTDTGKDGRFDFFMQEKDVKKLVGGDICVTNMDVWKEEKIKEIEEMDVGDVIDLINEEARSCDYCIKSEDCDDDCYCNMREYFEKEIKNGE